jgi:hypothetical protein
VFGYVACLMGHAKQGECGEEPAAVHKDLVTRVCSIAGQSTADDRSMADESFSHMHCGWHAIMPHMCCHWVGTDSGDHGCDCKTRCH